MKKRALPNSHALSCSFAILLTSVCTGAHAIERVPAPKPMPAPTVIKQTPMPQNADRIQPGNAVRPDWKAKRVDPSKASSTPFQRKSDRNDENGLEDGSAG